MNRLPQSTRRFAAGFSLVELMIALVLGAFLMMGLVQVFAASRAAYSTSEGMARTQENGRFAMDNLQRDLRMAGHFGCTNDQSRLQNGPAAFALSYASAQTEASYAAENWALQFNVSLQGYEANGTAPGGALTLLATPVVAGAAGGNNWTPQLPAFLSALAVPGSDVVVLRYVIPENVAIDSLPTGAAPTITFDALRWDVLRAGVNNPGLFAVTDCGAVTVFTGTRGAAGNTIVAFNTAGDIGFSSMHAGQNATLHRAESVAYYVGIGASGQPALFRCRALNALGNCTPEELVEGVENLQFMYGQSLVNASTGLPTGYINTVVNAGALGNGNLNATTRANWRRVGTVQMGVVVRSPNVSRNDTRTTPFSVLGLAVTPPATDQRTRASYENSIALRNRLFGN